MKKNIFIILLLFSMQALVHSVTEEGITISKLSMKPVPFNERRDPVADSPYNAFDGDLKTAALYSDFMMEFSKPVTIDQIKIMNGNALSKDLFKKDNRERDIEITLYTVAVKPDKKAIEKKEKKVKPKKKDDKKIPLKDKEKKDKSSEAKTEKDKIEKAKTEKDKTDKDKTEKDKADKDKIEKDKIKKEKTDKESEKLYPTEKAVNTDEYYTGNHYESDDVKLFFIASETAKEPVKNKEKVTNKNVIEIIDSKNDKQKKKKDAVPVEKKRKKPVKEVNSEAAKGQADKTEIKKTLAGEDKSKKNKTDKSSNKAPVSEKKKIETKKPEKKKQSTQVVKKIEKKKPVDTAVKNKSEKDKTLKKETDKNKIDITESKDKTRENKLPEADKKISEGKKDVKPEIKKINNEQTAESKNKKAEADKKIEVTKKEEKEKEKKKEKKKAAKKKEKKKIAEKKPAEDTTVKKMAGIVKIENDIDGRVMVYSSLKDTMEFQSIDLKGEYAVKKIAFRTRDDEYYMGTEPDRASITEISFLNNGKSIPVQGIQALKDAYVERYNKILTDSISGETFIMNENNDVILRMTFKKDGKIEFYDRFKCRKKGDADCTSVLMPDRWQVAGGKLTMRYHTIWRVWKYDLDSPYDMLSDKNDTGELSRFMKIYFKSENGFTDKYLDLVKSDKSIWAE